MYKSYRVLLCCFILNCLVQYINAQTWESLNEPPFLRHHTNGFGVEDGAYVFEGVSGNQYSNAFWKYDATNDSWTQISDFPGEARALAIGDDWDGKYYYGFGSKGSGQGNYLSDLWVFDPVDESFTQLPSCPCQGREHPALIAHNDKVFVGSGSFWNGDLDDWWEYDISTQEWTARPFIPGGERHHPYHFAAGEHVYVGGGHRTNWLQYDIANMTWTTIDNAPGGRVAGTQFNYDGKGYVLAGDNAQHSAHVPNATSFMRYIPGEDRWETLPPLPATIGRWAPASFIIGTQVYFMGGINFDVEGENLLYRFDLALLDQTSSSDDLTAPSITVYPNPTVNFIYIDGEYAGARVSIYNFKGQLVYTDQSYNSNDGIPVESLSSGQYSISLQLDDVEATSSFVKQ